MLDRMPLHSADEGLSPTACELLLGILRDQLRVEAKEIMDCYLRNEGMRDIFELDQKLARIGEPWLRLIPSSSTGEGRLAQLAADVVAVGVATSVVHDPHRQLQQLPNPEFLAAIEHTLHDLEVSPRGVLPAGAFAAAVNRIAQLFWVRLLPYAIDQNGTITWAGEPGLHQVTIAPALAALADPRLATAREEFDKARGDLRRGELKDAGKAAGDAVETTMAVLLAAHGHQQPRGPGGHDLVQAGALFDALKAKSVALLDQERDHALIFGPMKVRHTCGHGAGADPRPQDPAYVEAGVAAAAVAIAFLASKLP
jgi:hypothetical protein